MLLLAAACAPGANSGGAAGRPNFLVILIDTLRRDHLSCYGYERATSPNIDRLAADGVVFDRCLTVAPWTYPTVKGLFSGRYPRAVVPAGGKEAQTHEALPESITTLAEALRDRGYRTAALVDNPGLSPDLHYDQGFDEYGFLPAGWNWTDTPPDEFLAAFIRQRDRSIIPAHAPFFWYVHIIYPHMPYAPRPPFDGRFGPGYRTVTPEERNGVINCYDEEILMADDLVGRMVGALQACGLLDSTWIILVSDHGEAFWEHGVVGHGNSLQNEILRVPLIVRPPGGRASPRAHVARRARIPDPVTIIDLYPTLLDLAGAPPGVSMDGISLRPLLASERSAARFRDRALMSENGHNPCIQAGACQDARYKLLFTPPDSITDAEAQARLTRGEDVALFDLAGDPGEQRDVRAERPMIARRMERQLKAHWVAADLERSSLAGETKKLDPATVARLKALGYVR